MESRRSISIAAWYAAILGIIYLIIGMVEFTAGLYDLFSPGAVEGLLIFPADVFGGFSAFVTGAAYTIGGVSLLGRKQEAIGFLLAAFLLSMVFGGLYLLIVCADGFETLISLCEGGKWTWEWLAPAGTGTGNLRPEILLAAASSPLGYITLKAARKKLDNKTFKRSPKGF